MAKKMRKWDVTVNYLMGTKHVRLHIYAQTKKKAEYYAMKRVERKFGPALMYVEYIKEM